MSEMKPIKYRSRDGLTINGYLTLPKGTNGKNLPVVVNPHGGPWARDNWGYKSEIQFLANRGFAVFQMNFRGKKYLQNINSKNIPLIETQDPLKIVVNTSKAGIDGFTADKFFYRNGLIAELPEMMTLTFCLGFGNQKDFLNLFEKLWKKLLLNSKKSKSLEVLRSPFKLVQAPEIEIGIAWRSKTRSISFSQSLNKISGDIICPYPPGIPLLIPGEKIDIDRFNWINNQSLCNKDLVNFNIRVLEK